MPGGRKHNKKRRKKNWRSMLEGCFNKNPFSAPSSNAREDPQRVNDKLQSGKNSPKIPSDTEGIRQHSELQQQFDDSYTSSRSEDVPIRGILKKSQTTSSIGSGIYVEAAVDVPDALLHSLRPKSEWSQVRPAYLLNQPEDQGSSRTSNGSKCAFSNQTQHFSSCKSSPETHLSSQLKNRPRPNSYHEGDLRSSRDSPSFENPYSTPDVVHKRFVHSSNDYRSDASRQRNEQNNDPYKQPTYYNVRNRRLKQSADVEGFLESPVYSRPAYMRYELDQAYSHPLQATQSPSSNRLLSPEHARFSSHNTKCPDADPVYVKLEQIQQRKLEQKAQQRNLNTSSQQLHQKQVVASPKGQKSSALVYPPSSWHGSAILAASSAPPTRRKLLPMLEYRSPSITKKLSCTDNSDFNTSKSDMIPIPAKWKEIDSEVEVYTCSSPKSSPKKIAGGIARNANVVPKQRFGSNYINSEKDQKSLTYSRYVTSALPRSRDPIRKPMGSRSSLSPNNPLARVLPVGVRDWDSSNELFMDEPLQDQSHHMYDHQMAFRAAQSVASSLMGAGACSGPALEPDANNQTVEVSSQIYATVTRSSKCQGRDGASYVYTSCVSWKKKETQSPSRLRTRVSPNTNYTYSYSDDEDDEFYSERSRRQRVCRTWSPHSSPPPLPPRQWSPRCTSDGTGQYSVASASYAGGYCRVPRTYPDQRQYSRQQQPLHPSGGCHRDRPPLPSYEEILESRIRYGRSRPVSWCGFGSQQHKKLRLLLEFDCYSFFAFGGLDTSVGRGLALWPRGRGFEPQPSTDRAPTGWVGVIIM
ncbi:hypothetical protein ElyMa_006387000 [Elysia marginata]|uniref:Uncharacterized protein n=1 Tax=Elysia marginata TaxID=1093978 RepID=A0AAV4HT84_9GAST|nr:hypothetical protein ElyMa_006387000 [Elysia marginata]